MTPGCSQGSSQGAPGGRRGASEGVLGCAGHSRGPGRISEGARGTGLTPDCPARPVRPSRPSIPPIPPFPCFLSAPGPGHVTLGWLPLGLQPPAQPGSAPAPSLLTCEFLCLFPSSGNAHTTFRSHLLLEACPDAPAELGGASVLVSGQPLAQSRRVLSPNSGVADTRTPRHRSGSSICARKLLANDGKGVGRDAPHNGKPPTLPLTLSDSEPESPGFWKGFRAPCSYCVPDPPPPRAPQHPTRAGSVGAPPPHWAQKKASGRRAGPPTTSLGARASPGQPVPSVQRALHKRLSHG